MVFFFFLDFQFQRLGSIEVGLSMLDENKVKPVEKIMFFVIFFFFHLFLLGLKHKERDWTD